MDLKYFTFVKESKQKFYFDKELSEIPVVKIVADSDEFIPSQQHFSDAAADIKSSIDVTLLPNKVEMIDGGFSVGLPKGYHAKILCRSSMGKKGIIIPNSPGLIDTGYTGRICVLLLNLSAEPYKIAKGDRIAQFMIEKNINWCWENTDQLAVTDRGVGGFGSSGT
jgi:dUTP pyrophosphatase